MRSGLIGLLVLTCGFGLATRTFAQENTAELRGRVVDTQDAGIPGVTILVTNEATGIYRQSVSTADEHHDHEPQWSLGRTIGSLLAASALAAWMSEILVGAAEGTGKALGMSEVFIGIVFLAIIGGAAESGSAIAMARKNKLDLTIGIAMGSSIQIALFVAPVLVLLSGFIAPAPLELSFSRAEIGTLFLAVLIGAIVAGDGRSNWYKGVQLTVVYAMIAILFYFLPAGVH